MSGSFMPIGSGETTIDPKAQWAPIFEKKYSEKSYSLA